MFGRHAVQGGVERQGIGDHFDGAVGGHRETLVRRAIGAQIGAEGTPVEQDVPDSRRAQAQGTGRDARIHRGHFEDAVVDEEGAGEGVGSRQNQLTRASAIINHRHGTGAIV